MRTALLLAFATACSAGEASEPAPARTVVTIESARGPAVDRLILLGDVHGKTEVRVFADFPERVRTLHVAEGDVVQQGDPIATLDGAVSGAEVAQASAAVRAAEAQRNQIQADIARLRPLVQMRAAPRSQLEQLEASLASAEAMIAQSASGRRSASLRRARTVVRAPVAGTVAMLAVDEGDMAAPQMPLCSVVDASELDIAVRVVEQDFVRLREGMDAQVTPPALPEAARRGAIVALSPVLDPLSRTGEVTVRVDNADGRIRPGMVAEIAIELQRREDVLLIPSRAVLMTTRTDEDRTAAVYVVEDGTARRRAIVLGRRYAAEEDGESQLEVVEGLRGGETLVVMGQQLLRDGAAVEAQPEGRVAPEELDEARTEAQGLLRERRGPAEARLAESPASP
ncbi:MAG: efflux RND transporter periplasmic adaptor subunit [Myxococcota bacterium]